LESDVVNIVKISLLLTETLKGMHTLGKSLKTIIASHLLLMQGIR
jgi:hypothetical protein